MGPLFAGLDSLIWYIPTEEQCISCAIPSLNKFSDGDFTEACVQTKFIDTHDLFKMSNYRVYGSNYPIVHYRNSLANNNLRVLILGDSFSIPVKAFMSTTISEVDSIDPRYYTYETIAQYVLWNRPDIVIDIRHIPTEDNIWGGSEHTVNTCEFHNIQYSSDIIIGASKKKITQKN